MSSEPQPTLLGHEQELERAWRAAREGRLAHALLFRGPRGIGKFLAQRELTQGLLCATGPGRPCGVCPPCKRFKSGNHADVLIIDVAADDEEQLKVERIASRSDSDFSGTPIDLFLHLKPLEGGWRVVAMRDAQRMTEAAQNAFLKTLEEPAPGTLLLLESSEPERLLPTLRSRLIEVELRPLSVEQVRLVLAREGVAPELLAPLSRWSRGSPGRALEDRARGLPLMRELLAQAIAGQLSAAEAATALWKAPGQFVGKTPAAKARNRLRSILELGLDLLGDAARVRSGLTADELVHGDLAESIAARLGAEALPVSIGRWLELRRDTDLNLNAEAVLHRALGVLVPRRAAPAAGEPASPGRRAAPARRR